MKKLLLFLLLGLMLSSVAFGGIFDFMKKKKKETKNEKTVISFASGAVGVELELTKKAAEKYMAENPNVTVVVRDVPDSASARLALYLQFLEAKSSTIDLFQIDVVWPGDMADHLLDLNEYGAQEVAKEHFAPMIENNTVDGKLVAIPWFTDAGLLYYREDLLDKYSLDVPSTWDELEKSAKIIQEGERSEGNEDFWGYVWQGDSYEGLTCNAIEWLDSNGAGRIVDNNKLISVNNPNTIASLNRAKSWIGTISPSGVIGMKEESSRAVWQSGNAAFMRNWPYAYGLGNSDDSVIKGKFGTAALPKGKGGKSAAALGGWQLAVSKYSESPEAAADFALFLASYEVQKMRAIEGSYNPTIKALYQDPEVLAANEFFGSLYDVFLNASPRPSTITAPYYNQVSQKFYSAVYSVLTDQEDATTAMEYLESDIQEITDLEIAK